MGADNAGVGYATPAAVLDRVLDEVLVSADDWCQGAAAMDADGVSVATDSDQAVKFCMIGAIKRATAWELGLTGLMQNQYPIRYWDLVGDISNLVTSTVGYILWFNDSPNTTFEDVRLVFKQAREMVS